MTDSYHKECASPNYVKEVVESPQAPGVTAQDIKVLRRFLANNDSAGMYLMLYRLAGEEFWLMDAQITTFSGIWGGTALEANYQIKLRNPSKYDDSIVICCSEGRTSSFTPFST